MRWLPLVLLAACTGEDPDPVPETPDLVEQATGDHVWDHLVDLLDLWEEHGDRYHGAPGHVAAVEWAEARLDDADVPHQRHLFLAGVPEREGINLIATIDGSDPDLPPLVVGGHLDEVRSSPGIVDNGSGSMTALELALQLPATEPDRTVIVALWSAEDIMGGPYGSAAWVDDLDFPIQGYLNLDMLASTNGVRETMQFDDVPGSDAFLAATTAWFDEQGLAYEIRTQMPGNSDHGPFLEAGIPVGYLKTGAFNLKTEEEAATYGGTAGESYHPCIHLECDDLDAVNVELLDHMVSATARAVQILSEADDAG